MTTPSGHNKKITAILFDVGGVLLSKLSDIDEQICRILDLNIESSQKAQEEVIATDVELIEEWKHITTLVKEVAYLNKFYTRVFKVMGVQKSSEEIQIATMCQVKRGYKINSGAISTLRYLSKKYDLGIVTNCYVSRKYFEFVDYDLNKYFKAIIISREINSDKPEAVHFQKCFELLKVKPENVALIDDKQKNLKAGEQFGISRLIQYKIKKGKTSDYRVIRSLGELKSIF